MLDEMIADRTLFGTPLHEWLLLVGVTVAVTIALYLVHRLVAWRFGKIATKTSNHIDDYAAALLRDTRLYFFVAIGLYVARTFVELSERVEVGIGRLAFILVMLQVIRWGNTFITTWVRRYKVRMLEHDAAAVTTMQAVSYVARLVLWSVAILLVLDNFDVDITALVAGLGIGGVAVALALQNILGDLFASLSIVLDKPFVVGDFLIVGDFLGSVEKIGLKTTRLRSLSGEQLVFSNSDLLSSRIRNYQRMFERRIVFSFGVTYQTPPDQLARIGGMVKEIVESQQQTRFDRAHFKGFGDYALTFEVVYYVLVPDFNTYMDVQEQINLALYRQLADEGVEFAYPTQTLYVQQATPTTADAPQAAGYGGLSPRG